MGQRPMVIDAAAGGRGGSWWVLLEGLARLVADVHPWLALRVVPGGGVENHAGVGTGRPQAAILNPPMTAAALAGRAPFTQRHSDLRVAVANLTVNHLQLLVDARQPVDALARWPERRWPLRLPVDRIGTVDRLAFDRMLAHLGVAWDDVARWGGALLPAANYDEQLALYRAERIDGFWQVMAIPSPSIAAAQALRPLRPVPLPGALVEELAAVGFTATALPAGAYGIDAGPAPTVAMGTSLGFHASVPDEVVAAVTGAILDHPERVRAIHPAAGGFDPRRAAEGAGGPLHPGAVTALRARGLG